MVGGKKGADIFVTVATIADESDLSTAYIVFAKYCAVVLPRSSARIHSLKECFVSFCFFNNKSLLIKVKELLLLLRLLPCITIVP